MIPKQLPSDQHQYQTYFNHKQIVGLKMAHKPRGYMKNLNQERNARVSTNTNCKFSADSQKKLKSIIYNWGATVFILKETTDFKKKHKNISKLLNFNFITLTIPQKQMHSDYQLKVALNRFFDSLERVTDYKFNYVWRAETQENGNIHFHILMDHWFPIWLLKQVWNSILEKLGYLSGLEFINPSTMHLKTVKSLKHIWTYLYKYCSKNSYNNRRGVAGHQWGSSQEIKKMEGKKHISMTDDEWFSIITNSMQSNTKIQYVNEVVTIIYLTTTPLSSIVGKSFALEWLNVMKQNFDFILPTLLNYKYFTTWTSNDYELCNSSKFNYLNHSDDTNLSHYYEKYDDVTIHKKMALKLNQNYYT